MVKSSITIYFIVIALAVQVKNYTGAHDFRAIAYCTVICKIIGNILVIIIQNILGFFIGVEQNAFVESRYI